MNQAQERVEEQVGRLPSDIGGDDRGAPGITQRSAPGGESWHRHAVNIRLTIPLPFGRYYVTIVAGKERRSGERLASERKKHPLMKLGNLVVMAACGTICGLAALSMFQLATAYVLLRSGMLTFGQ